MRRIVASLLPLLVAAPLMAQTMVGVRAGLNRATWSEVFNAETWSAIEALGGATIEDPRMGAVAGIDVAFPVAAVIELRVGGAYAQKGYSLSFSGPGVGGSYAAELDYLQFSALGRVGSTRDGPLSVGVLLGPWMAFRLSCELSGSSYLAEFGSMGEFASCADEGRKGDFGVAAGGGVELAVSDGLSLGLDLVYSIGLSRIDDDPYAPKNRSLAVQAGVVIPVGG